MKYLKDLNLMKDRVGIIKEETICFFQGLNGLYLFRRIQDLSSPLDTEKQRKV